MENQIYNPNDQPVIEKVMPVPHMMIRLVRANNTYFVAGRGSGKTTNGIALYMVDCVTELPRSTGVIVTPSYEHAGDNTLNPLFNALNQDGFQQGIHYVVAEQPPRNWEKPLIRVESKKYDHTITWWNGVTYFVISLAKKGAANGISAQHGCFDELKLMDERILKDVVYPIFRGNEKAVIDDENHPNHGKRFVDSPLYMSKFFATDKLADPAAINWILDKKHLNNPQKLDLIVNLQICLNDLKETYNTCGINERRRLKNDINAVEARLSILRRDTTFYVEANHKDTIQILGQRWYDDKVSSLQDSPRELAVAIRNEDPDRPENGFYPDFSNEVHVHEQKDYNPHKPFIIAPDYQHSVSPIPIAQIGQLPGDARDSLNYVDHVYTTAPKGLEDAVELLCERYKAHQCKQVYYVYDHTAKGKRNGAETFCEIVVSTLQKHGWLVIEVYTGKAPNHYAKYTDTKKWLSEEDKEEMPIRVNKKCDRMISSITSAGAKMANGKTEKDKRHEDTNRYPKMDQTRTTHFSDCFDMINHAVLKLKRINFGGWFGGGLSFK